MLDIKVIEQDELGKVSSFIAELNQHEESHIGFCGKEQDEIADCMKNDMDDINYTDSFIVAYEGNELVGVLGFDADFENSNAEIWGPFIVPRKWDIVYDMWNEMTGLLTSEIDSLEMFPNLKNERACQFAKAVSFEKHSDESILTFRNDRHELKSDFIEEMTPTYYDDMKQLHDEAFPGAYYSGQQIIKRLDEDNKVFIKTNDGVLIGYIYVEVEPKFGDGSIEFFAVKESEKGRGVGKELLTGALKWLFTYETIQSITLCVNSTNASAINLYKKAGFQHQHDLCSFTKNLKTSSAIN
ncbi:GNAT family N-acetyltransferase [Alkalibacillus haloalkaliphilus]|uniref:GNAT family N-acetyltransferase n=1 Tax=Alkalibacillus haloalkaliphilus TaxID=94136 RepID=UPI002936A41F|nr:GNAT family N-acetyltransferase [Alkalibacillus haloalkaliphilus]MDV2582386.1 GNAT family N-acetyltransferase [Alkalibacillus haloalkaliphilus]